MFPRFEYLTEERFDANCEKLTQFGIADAPSGVRILQRLRDAWLASEGYQASKRADSKTPSAAPIWYETLERVVREAPLRGVVLNVVDQYVRNATEQLDAFALFEQSRRSLEILARLACGSPFLTQILLADPSWLTNMTLPGRTAEMKSREQFVSEAMAVADQHPRRTARTTRRGRT